jgi:acetyl-CoA acyltransferase
MTEICIVEAVRSAVGRAHKGSLVNKRPDELAGDVMRALLARVPAVKPEMVDDVVLGCAMPEGEQGLNVARLAALLAGMPAETSAMTINRFCSSGLQAIALAAGSIALGHHTIVIAGGVESMSMVPMTGYKISASPELMEKAAAAYTPMGITAELVAKRFEVSRAQQDAFALGSHTKAAAARKAGKFEEEIVSVRAIRFQNGARVESEFRTDELVREDTTAEGLAALKPSFALGGTVTPGNASPLSDGAAASLVMTRQTAEKLGLKPRALFKAFATAGVDPAIMGIGPIPAIRKLFAKTGLGLKDIDVFEINEAFAAQAAYVQRELAIPDEKLNPVGGAIALGHPLGCTGAKLTATIIRELERRGARRGIVSMCIGGGMGAAGLIELP